MCVVRSCLSFFKYLQMQERKLNRNTRVKWDQQEHRTHCSQMNKLFITTDRTVCNMHIIETTSHFTVRFLFSRILLLFFILLIRFLCDNMHHACINNKCYTDIPKKYCRKIRWWWRSALCLMSILVAITRNCSLKIYFHILWAENCIVGYLKNENKTDIEWEAERRGQFSCIHECGIWNREKKH